MGGKHRMTAGVWCTNAGKGSGAHAPRCGYNSSARAENAPMTSPRVRGAAALISATLAAPRAAHSSATGSSGTPAKSHDSRNALRVVTGKGGQRKRGSQWQWWGRCGAGCHTTKAGERPGGRTGGWARGGGGGRASREFQHRHLIGLVRAARRGPPPTALREAGPRRPYGSFKEKPALLGRRTHPRGSGAGGGGGQVGRGERCLSRFATNSQRGMVALAAGGPCASAAAPRRARRAAAGAVLLVVLLVVGIPLVLGVDYYKVRAGCVVQWCPRPLPRPWPAHSVAHYCCPAKHNLGPEVHSSAACSFTALPALVWRVEGPL